MPGQASSSERPAKRSRVSRACDQCRAAREKCDGTQPTCLTCSASPRSCSYTSAPKKRGIQPGYIRTLELALTWLFQNTDSEALLNRKVAQEGIRSVLFGRETKESNRLHKSWRRSKFCKDVDKLLSGEEVGDDQTPKSEDDDSSAEADAVTVRNQPPPPDETLSPNTHSTSPAVLRQAVDLGQPREGAGPLPTPQSQSPTLLPASSWRLLDIYFAYTQSWLPICEKHDVLRVSYSYPDHGLILSATDLPDPGDHAELWSILAVAAHQARVDPHEAAYLPDTEQLYTAARALIPGELGSFSAGHVKALLNLAVIDMGRGNAGAAWLLVGSASRVMTLIERSSTTAITRSKHLLAGCYLLDGFLSLQLGKTYLQRSDIHGIEEDGLDEWQPWANPIFSASAPPSRTPALGLSSFNKLLDLTDILVSLTSNRSDAARTPHQQLSRLDYWKASLPAKFGYITDQHKQSPFNPPAILLHATYVYTSFVLRPSQAPIHYFVELAEKYCEQLGIHAIPPMMYCLLSHIKNHSAYPTFGEGLQIRLQKICQDLTKAWSDKPSHEAPTLNQVPARTQGRPSNCAYQVPTPESIQIPFNPPFTPLTNRPPSNGRPPTTLLDDLLPDMNTTTVNRPSTDMGMSMGLQQNFNVPPLDDEFRRPSLQQHRHSTSHSMVPPDLENFFDELASLDGAEKIDSQPQFMENLGFAPDVNMADFLAAEFGQFIPGNSSAFLPQHHDDPTHLDPVFFGTS